MTPRRVSARPIVFVSMIVLLALMTGCGDSGDSSPTTATSNETADFAGQEARLWVDEILERIEADAVSPPVASRIFGYTGLALYESTVDGMPDHRSLGGQIEGLESPPDPQGGWDAPTVMHSALGHLVPMLFADEASREHLTDYAEERLEQRHDAVGSRVWSDSVDRGVLIAEIIATRASTDGYHGRDEIEYHPPVGPGSWEQVDPDREPLEPNWSTLQPFVLQESDDCRPAPPVDFSTRPESEFYQQARAVVDATPEPGEEEHEIARFWADNPGETSTPPGHWMALAGQMVEKQELDLAETARLYALLGMTAADAFISCWDEKYRSYLIRPVTYIRDHVDPDWETIIPTPPFPEYTSGHANVSGASAVVLTDRLGEVSFEDRTHVDRGFAPRSFDSFEAAAREAGRSRIYGGVHYPMANEEGLEQGRCVARQVLEGIQMKVETDE